MVSGNYTTPVTVNGFTCRNCTDVGYASKQIDPAHPQSGPNDVDAAKDPSQPAAVRLKLEDARKVAADIGTQVAAYSARGLVPAAVEAGLVVDATA